MTRPDKDQEIHQDKVTDSLKANCPEPDKIREKSVRGSGFTYDEEKERIDISVPADESKDDGIEKPDLGKPNTA